MIMLRKLFQKRKEVPQEVPKPSPPEISDLLSGTAKELHDLGVRYAVVSIAATEDNQDVIALRTASLRLERMSRQFSMSANLLKSRRIDEETE
jgi:hypothetical protein